MTILKKTYRNLVLLTTGLLLSSGFSACKESEEAEPQGNSVSNYINLILWISSSEGGITRTPTGGEDGDGREAGFERENKVEGITLILYKGTGIDDATAKVNYVDYFTVTESNLEGRDPQGTTYDYQASETFRSEARYYTTGDQKLADDFDLSGTYHVLIVANRDVRTKCTKGTLISTVRDLTTSDLTPSGIYTNDTPGTPSASQQFVMTTERDATINFASMAPVRKDGVKNGMVYRVMQPLLIERLSARIDYNTKGSTYNSDRGGYEYNVGTTGDKFVVTGVIPFNLYNGTEYLFKRVVDAWPATATTYFGDETTINYVADPSTLTKDNASDMPAYLSPIAKDMSTSDYSDYLQEMATAPAGAHFTDASGDENIIIAYPKENTLMPTSQLKKYATGLAFVGGYYNKTNDTNAPNEIRTYYHFLRHQGENSTGVYQAKKWSEITEADVCGTAKAMNFGIVRNNIYRVDIEGFTPSGGIMLKIKVKKWDKFEHKPIYL